MKSAIIRKKFIDYFTKHKHIYVPSSPLVPQNDPSLLFTNAGMNQFKNIFIGNEKRNYKRAVSCQKCLRAGGKHNDLESVGITYRHHTFFEMLGNFSFGDYFKKEAIHYAWDFLTNELNIPKEKLYITVFKNDQEAAEIWHKQEKIAKNRIFYLSEKDNFWKMGDTGPCGPCSEIFYNFNEDNNLKSEDIYRQIIQGGDKVVEIWNLVFMQFYEKEKDNLILLTNPSIDTGAGLERLSAVMQNTINNFNTDCFIPIIEKIIHISKLPYDLNELSNNIKLKNQYVATKVLADHIRATIFLIAEGVYPSNEARGYVLRRIIRRAIRYERKLCQHPIFPHLTSTTIKIMKDIYPEIISKEKLIKKILEDEEEKFRITLDQGNLILQQSIKKLKSNNQYYLPGEVVFKLYDTYGFPVDLTQLIAKEENINIDYKSFEKYLAQAKEKAKKSWKGNEIIKSENHLRELIKKVEDQYNIKKTSFLGYNTLNASATLLALSNGEKEVLSLKEGEKGIAIFDQSPFYAQSGGQINDIGYITNSSDNLNNNDDDDYNKKPISVYDCQKSGDFHLHYVKINKENLNLNQKYELKVNPMHRQNIKNNHSATHLLHYSLRKILGNNVSQAGSLVEAERLRFDFTYDKPLSSVQIEEIQKITNNLIAANFTAKINLQSYDEAIKIGAMALFEEKYESQVRTIQMGPSIELCGGTHIKNTSEIRLFIIVSEQGVSAGIRRIEALSGDIAFTYLMNNLKENNFLKNLFGVSEHWSTFVNKNNNLINKSTLINVIKKEKEQIKTIEKELKQLKKQNIDINKIISNSKEYIFQSTPIKFINYKLPIDDRKIMAETIDQIKNKISSGIIFLIGENAKSSPILLGITNNLTNELNADKIIKEITSILDGKGGGRKDFAQGTIKNIKNLPKAIEKIENLIKNIQ